MRRKLFGFLLFVILLSACANHPASPAVGTELPTTQSSSITPVPISTSTKSILSDLPEPTETKVPTPTITDATKSAYTTAMAQSDQLEQQNREDCLGYPDFLRQNPNPKTNKDWRIAFCLTSDTHLGYTKIIKRDGTLSWIIPFYETYGINAKSSDFPDGIKDGEMLLTHWSSDGRFVYIEPYWCCVDGPGYRLYNTWALYRLNLNTGFIRTILPPGTYSTSISSDDKFLIYGHGEELSLLNLDTMGENRINTNPVYDEIGFFDWSPESDKVIFIGATGAWWEENDNGLSLLVLDLKSMVTTILIQNDNRLIEPLSYATGNTSWINSDEIKLMDSYGNKYLYRLSTKTLIPELTPTPTSTP